MSANSEMRGYLWLLLDHEASCTIEDCTTCQTALNVYDLIRSRIFSVRKYPEVMHNAESPASDGVDASNETPGRTMGGKAP
jgi:hypothetical protein